MNSKNAGKVLVISVFLLSGFVFQQGYAYGTGASEAKGASAETLSVNPVNPGSVCMVNDTVMGKPQIPVKFEGKTYYGCCQGCVARLQNDRSSRFAKDPITGSEVDKATAFIVAAPDETALYFESRETALKYRALMSQKEKR